MTLSIIILSYNTKNLLQACLKSIFDEIHSVEFEVIVVDNNSSDNSADMVKREFKKVKIIQNTSNVGFPKGCNTGAKSAKGKYLLFLNSDTIIQKDKIKEIFAVFEKDDKVAVVGGQLQNDNKTIQKSFGSFYTIPNVIQLLFGKESIDISGMLQTPIQKVDWVSGGCMFVKKKVFDEVGGFDEKIFMYVEDAEFCYRIKKAGYEVLYDSQFRVIHKGQGSSHRSFAIMHIYKGILYYFKKHKSGVEYGFIKMILYTKALSAICFGIVTGNKYLIHTYKNAIKFSQ